MPLCANDNNSLVDLAVAAPMLPSSCSHPALDCWAWRVSTSIYR